MNNLQPSAPLHSLEKTAIHSPLVIALDFANAERALEFSQYINPKTCRVKVGLELFTRAGIPLIEQLKARGFEIFLDLKFHDIPNTVAKACEAAAALGVWMINVHALGGRDMLVAAREAVEKFNPRPLLIAVSVLTSLDEKDLYAMGLHGTLEENVLRMARLSKANNLDGLVCSPHELKIIRENLGEDFVLVTPGIRPVGSELNDQKRVMSPREALHLGASYLVMGRPITGAAHPQQVIDEVLSSLW